MSDMEGGNRAIVPRYDTYSMTTPRSRTAWMLMLRPGKLPGGGDKHDKQDKVSCSKDRPRSPRKYSHRRSKEE